MANLLETLTQQLTPGLVQQISQQLGTDPQTTQQGINLALPLLVSAISRAGSTPQGANALNNAVTGTQADALFGQLTDVVRGYQSGSGNDIIGLLLGGQRRNVETTMSKATGVDAAALLQILAPIVLGVLNVVQQRRSLDAGGLSTYMQGQQQKAQQGNGDLMGVIGQMLDTNRDGSAFDEIAGMASQFLSSRR